MKEIECCCEECISAHNHDAIVRIDQLIFLLQLALIFMIFCDVGIVVVIAALCLGWA